LEFRIKMNGTDYVQGGIDPHTLPELAREIEAAGIDAVEVSGGMWECLSEPDLPRRWMEGRGKSGTDCISCNACLYDMLVHPGRETPGRVHCVFKAEEEKYKAAQEWVATWAEQNVAR
jgi:2,4-dienoyl-CoA reductase-like NADH-dependent reductase (Old Yellow Enzyme family)